jgi:hypothetical protein
LRIQRELNCGNTVSSFSRSSVRAAIRPITVAPRSTSFVRSPKRVSKSTDSSSSRIGALSRFSSIRPWFAIVNSLTSSRFAIAASRSSSTSFSTSDDSSSCRMPSASSALSSFSGRSARMPSRIDATTSSSWPAKPSLRASRAAARFSGSIASRRGRPVLRMVSTSSGSSVRSIGIRSPSAIRASSGSSG